MGRRSDITISDEEFIQRYQSDGPTVLSKQLNVSIRTVFQKRSDLEGTLKTKIASAPREWEMKPILHKDRIPWELKNGSIIVGSDFHIWPGNESTALRGFKKIVAEIKPQICCLNGDVLDFPQISRHPPMGWESIPSPAEEIECAQDHLDDIIKAGPRGMKRGWTLGNHDARFEMRLASQAREYKNIKGIHLSDHFPLWDKGWSAWVNNEVVIKHRWKGGIHAPWNNTIYSGKTMVTGHLHSQKITPFTDYNGTRYGVDTGCVAEPYHQAFSYAEDNPRNWISGFAVFTFKDGKLLYPDLASVWSDNSIQFRGQIIRV